MTRLGLVLLGLFLTPLFGLAQPPQPRLDAHGFPLPDGAVARIGDLHFAQPHEITAIAVSPDGKVVATAGRSPQCRGGFFGDTTSVHVHIWNAETGRITRSDAVPGGIRLLEFSPSGKLLTMQLNGPGATVLDLATGRAEHWPPRDDRDDGTSGEPIPPRFLDEDRVVVCYESMSPRIRVWDRTTGKPLRDWRSKKGKIEALKLVSAQPGSPLCTISPSGRWMAWAVLSARAEGEVTTRHDLHVFNTLTGELKGTIKGVADLQGPLQLLDEGATLLFGNVFPKAVEQRDGKWVRQVHAERVALDVPTGRERFRLPGWVALRALAPDGKTFYTRTYDDPGAIRRDVVTGQPVSDMLRGTHRSRLDFVLAADGKRTVVADHARWYWGDLDLKPLQPQTENPLPTTVAEFESNRRLRFHGRGAVRKIWDVAEGKVVTTSTLHLPPGTTIWTAGAWSCPHYKLGLYHRANRVFVHDLQTGRDVAQLENVAYHDRERPRLVFCPNGSRILLRRAEGADLRVRWYDSRSGRELGRYLIAAADLFPSELGRDPTWFSDDGSEFGYLTVDYRLALVDCATRKVRLIVGESRPYDRLTLGSPTWHYRRAEGLPFIAATGALRKDRERFEHILYEPSTGAVLRRCTVPGSHHAVTLSPDHRLALCRTSLEGELTLFETATGRPRGVIQTGAGASFTIRLSPDGKTLAVSCVDTTTLLWDLNRPLGGRPDLPPPQTAQDAAALWGKLADPDPREAERAIWALVRAPESALAMLKELLQPAAGGPVPGWLAQLDSPRFKEREVATQELLRLGDRALPSLRAALAKPASVEQQGRLEWLIARLQEQNAALRGLRELRALEVLERLGSPEARRLVETVAAGSHSAVVTLEAQCVLARWRKTPGSGKTLGRSSAAPA